MNEPYVNYELMERVLNIRERTPEEIQLSETINITDLWNKAINFTEDELIVCVMAAMYVCPDKVYQALAEDREELLRKGKRRNEDSNDVREGRKNTDGNGN